MAQDIETFCMSCGACAASKDANSKLKGLLHSLPILDRPCQSIGMDFLGPLPQWNNFDYLLVIIDWLMTQVHLVLTMTTVTAKGVAWIVLEEVVRLHKIPESIVSNRDTWFTFIFWRELQKPMGTKLLMSMAFHLQTNGTTEWANRSVAQKLQTVEGNDQKNWSEKCSMAEFAINSSINTITGYAPSKLNYGYMLWSGQHISMNTMFKGVKQFAQQVLWNLIDAHDAILEHKVMQTHYSNKCQRPSVIYRENDMVYLSTKNLALPRAQARKLMPRFLGPYRVLKACYRVHRTTLGPWLRASYSASLVQQPGLTYII